MAAPAGMPSSSALRVLYWGRRNLRGLGTEVMLLVAVLQAAGAST